MFYARLLVRRLFGGPLPAEPEYDTDGYIPLPVLLEVRHRAEAGDWQAARAILDAAGEDWDLRSGLIGELSGVAAADDSWLYAWLRAEPSNPAAVLIQAEVLSERAGEARGSAPAANTSAQQFSDFHQLSAAAAQVGRRAMEPDQYGAGRPPVIPPVRSISRGPVRRIDGARTRRRRHDQTQRDHAGQH